MSQFVLVTDDESQADHLVELPMEEDGMLLLSTVEAQFNGATGLKYRAESGAFRGLRVSDGAIWPPQEGWGMTQYVVVMKEVSKRRHDGDAPAPPAKQYSMGGGGGNVGMPVTDAGETDLIVLGLPWTASNDDVKEHFSEFGQMALCQVNMDGQGRSKGFGFIRFSDPEANKKVVATRFHYVQGRRCEVKLPIRRSQEIPAKLFIGCLTSEISKEDLQTHFGTYGVITDLYVPQPFRGIAFIKYTDSAAAKHCLDMAPHIIKGIHLNVATPEPRKNPDTAGGRGGGGGGEAAAAAAAAAAAQLTPAASQALLGQLALAATGGAFNASALGIDMNALVQQQQRQPQQQQRAASQAQAAQHHVQQQQLQSSANVRPTQPSYHW